MVMMMITVAWVQQLKYYRPKNDLASRFQIILKANFFICLDIGGNSMRFFCGGGGGSYHLEMAGSDSLKLAEI